MVLYIEYTLVICRPSQGNQTMKPCIPICIRVCSGLMGVYICDDGHCMRKTLVQVEGMNSEITYSARTCLPPLQHVKGVNGLNYVAASQLVEYEYPFISIRELRNTRCLGNCHYNVANKPRRDKNKLCPINI